MSENQTNIENAVNSNILRQECEDAFDMFFESFMDLLQLQVVENSNMFQGLKSDEYLAKMDQITHYFEKVENLINYVTDPKLWVDFEFVKKWENINYCNHAVQYDVFLKMWEKHQLDSANLNKEIIQ